MKTSPFGICAQHGTNSDKLRSDTDREFFCKLDMQLNKADVSGTDTPIYLSISYGSGASQNRDKRMTLTFM